MRAGTLTSIIKGGNKIPFTHSQAKAICDNFQFLIGKEFDAAYKDISGVRHVVVSPHDKNEQQNFIQGLQPDKVLHPPVNRQKFFNVLVIAYLLPDCEVAVYKDIFSYTYKHQLDFNPDHFF